jgi:hypothetical protein
MAKRKTRQRIKCFLSSLINEHLASHTLSVNAQFHFTFRDCEPKYRADADIDLEIRRYNYVLYVYVGQGEGNEREKKIRSATGAL